MIHPVSQIVKIFFQIISNNQLSYFSEITVTRARVSCQDDTS